jgi:hypothetical protein
MARCKKSVQTNERSADSRRTRSFFVTNTPPPFSVWESRSIKGV